MMFDEDTVRSVVEHMNEDHQDACLCIARAFGPHRTATNAVLSNFDSDGLDMQITKAGQTSHSARIAFDKPLTRDSQIRGMLVAMTKNARTILSN